MGNICGFYYGIPTALCLSSSLGGLGILTSAWNLRLASESLARLCGNDFFLSVNTPDNGGPNPRGAPHSRGISGSVEV